MLKKKEKRMSVPNISSGEVSSYQTQISSSSYSSQTSVQRVVTKTYSTTSSISLPTISAGSRPKSIFDIDTNPLGSSTSISQSSTFPSRYSPVYPSLRPNKRPPLESAGYSKNVLSSPSTKSSTITTTSEYRKPDEKRPYLLPSSQSRSIFDTDARPFSPSAPISQPSGYQSIPRNPISSTTPLTNRNTNEFSQNRDPRVPTYVTNGKKRGKALIINNVKFMKKDEERKGAESRRFEPVLGLPPPL